MLQLWLTMILHAAVCLARVIDVRILTMDTRNGSGPVPASAVHHHS